MKIKKVIDKNIGKQYKEGNIIATNYMNLKDYSEFIKNSNFNTIFKLTHSKNKILTELYGKYNFSMQGEYKTKVWYLNVTEKQKEMNVLVFSEKGFGTTYEIIDGDNSLLIPFLKKMIKI